MVNGHDLGYHITSNYIILLVSLFVYLFKLKLSTGTTDDQHKESETKDIYLQYAITGEMSPTLLYITYIWRTVPRIGEYS